MGLAADQARLLFITNRTNSIEYRMMQLTNTKLDYTRKTGDASRKYSNSLNAKKLQFNEEDLSYNNLMAVNADNSQRMLLNNAGQVVLSPDSVSEYGLGSLDGSVGCITDKYADAKTFAKAMLPGVKNLDDLYSAVVVTETPKTPKADDDKTPSTTARFTTSYNRADIIKGVEATGKKELWSDDGDSDKDYSGVIESKSQEIAKTFMDYATTEKGTGLLDKVGANLLSNLTTNGLDSYSTEIQEAINVAKVATIMQYLTGKEVDTAAIALDSTKYEGTSGKNAENDYWFDDVTAKVANGTFGNCGVVAGILGGYVLSGIATGLTAVGTFIANLFYGSSSDSTNNNPADQNNGFTYNHSYEHTRVLFWDTTDESEANLSVSNEQMINTFLAYFDLYCAQKFGSWQDEKDSEGKVNGTAPTMQSLGYSNNGKLVNNDGTWGSCKSVATQQNSIYGVKVSKASSDAASADSASKETTDLDKVRHYVRLYNQLNERGWVVDKNVTNNSDLNQNIVNSKYIICQTSGLEDLARVSTTSASSGFKWVTDQEAIDKAKAEYETEKSDISYKESILDMELNQLETEHTSLESEKESVKSLIDKQCEKFKLFA